MRAIILAAGMGTRLRPLTNETPKALVTVHGEPIIERQIGYLREIGIEEIIVATGYLGDKFTYLEQKHSVDLIHNDKYDIYNNAYTMYLVRDYLQDAYVLEGDVYLTNNFLEREMIHSAYFGGVKEGFSQEWILEFDQEDKVIGITIGDGTGYIMSGVSYWSRSDGLKIKKKLEKMVEQKDFELLFWDDIVKDNLDDFDVYIQKIGQNDWFEIDSMQDLRTAETFTENWSRVRSNKGSQVVIFGGFHEAIPRH